MLINWRNIVIILLGLIAVVLLALRYSIDKGLEYRDQYVSALADERDALDALSHALSAHRMMNEALADRERERDSISARYISANKELSRLRRTNAEVRNWADRPIPDDVLQLLVATAKDNGGTRSASGDSAGGLLDSVSSGLYDGGFGRVGDGAKSISGEMQYR